MIIRVLRWSEFQHYNYRRVPWVKIYRNLLDDTEYRLLSPGARAYLIDLWLLASETTDGVLHMDAQDVAWRLRLELADSERWLTEIAAQRDRNGNLKWIAFDETDGVPVPVPVVVKPTPKAKAEKPATPPTNGEDQAAQFLRFFDTMPKRSGGNPRAGAFSKWEMALKAGATVAEIQAGAERYKKFCDTTGKTGGEYVKQARFWLAPEFQGWKEDWTAPEEDIVLGHRDDEFFTADD